MDFLNFRISTIAGIIVLLLVSFTVGAFIYYQMEQFMNMRFEVVDFSSSPEE